MEKEILTPPSFATNQYSSIKPKLNLWKIGVFIIAFINLVSILLTFNFSKGIDEKNQKKLAAKLKPIFLSADGQAQGDTQPDSNQKLLAAIL